MGDAIGQRAAHGRTVDGNFHLPHAMTPLAFTGERMTGAVGGQIEFEHYHRYCFARDLCAGLDVLDVAAGEGYGSALLAGVARSVVGVEIDAATVEHATRSYHAANLRFACGDALALPLPDASIDMVVSFETIEHVSDPARFIAEVRRVLRPGGWLVVSTPDRAVYSAPGSDANPYHVIEMTEPELRALLDANFAHFQILSQRPVLGSVLVAAGPARWRSYERRSDDIIEASPGLARAPYLIAIASDASLPDLPSSLYIDRLGVHAVTEAHARLAGVEPQLASLRAERDAAREEVTRNRAEYDQARTEFDQARAEDRQALAAHVAAHDHDRATIAALDMRSQQARAQSDALHADIRRLTAELDGQSGELAALTAVIAEHEDRHLASRTEIDARILAVAALQGELGGHAAEIARLHAALADHVTLIADLRAALTGMTAQHAALAGSLSLRLTAPLRAAGRRVPGLRRTLRVCKLVATGGLAAHLRLRRRRRADIAALRRCPLFDAAWYLEQHPALVAQNHDPVAHFAWAGAFTGASPNPWFDPAWYIARNPEIIATGENPLLHWVREGAASGRNPNPFLDARWYSAENPDIAASGLDPLLHWIRHGGPELRDPNPMLDARAYVLEYPHARDSGLDPLLHWWRHGVALGLNPHPLFDAGWYSDVNNLAGADPLAHWLQTGRALGLPTSPLTALHGAVPRHLCFAVEPDPLVSIIVPCYGHYADAYRCLAALMAGSGTATRYEVILADDCPQHRIAPLLAERVSGLRILQNRQNLGFLRSCNAAEQLAVGRYVIFLNDDATIHPGWLDPLVRLAEDDALVGMVGCKLLNTDGTVQEAGGALLRDGWGQPYGRGDAATRPEYNFVREVDVIVGACFLVRRAAFDALGGFDLRYAPAYYEEFDLAFALRDAGYRVMYQPASVVTHHGSNSYGAEMRDRQSARNHAQFCAKWVDALATQPVPGTREFLTRQRGAPAGAVLVMDDRVPEWDRHAGAMTISQYIRVLQDMGFRVSFAPAADQRPIEPYTTALRQQGVEVLCGEAGDTGSSTLQRWLDAHGRDLRFVWCARPDVAGPLLASIRAATQAPILYYTHDLHYLRERRRWELEGDLRVLDESKRLRRLESAIFARVDRVMTPSTDEAAIIRSEVPAARVHVIPPYIVVPLPTRMTAYPNGRDRIVFVGGFAHPPNVDAAVWLVDAIMPMVWAVLPDVRVCIVGPEPPAAVLALAGPYVEVTGYVPDLTPIYARARMTVSPLRYGAGVKGKIVGSVEAGVPVITTPLGNEGIDLLCGTDALIGGDAAELASAIETLWRDTPRAAAMAQNAKAHLRRYSPAAAAEALRDTLGIAQCRVCGHQALRRAPLREAPTPPCPQCDATTGMQGLADVMLLRYRRAHEHSLRALLPRLIGLRIHLLGADNALFHELRDRADATVSTTAGPAAGAELTGCADASVDLLIGHCGAPTAWQSPDAFLAFARVLKPGGRLLLGMHRSSPQAAERDDDIMTTMTRSGFEPVMHAPPTQNRADGAFLIFEGLRMPGMTT